MTDMKEPYWNRMVPELTVTDLPASLSFYTDVLGFSVMIRRTEPEFAYINLGDSVPPYRMASDYAFVGVHKMYGC
ncbi:VOC family protein [Erwinia sp. DT-104]|uniref:VOC family protein n=1 Tax=Erwinia sp. DT-104 TaxID=3396161 RepID=UPI003F1C918D